VKLEEDFASSGGSAEAYIPVGCSSHSLVDLVSGLVGFRSSLNPPASQRMLFFDGI